MVIATEFVWLMQALGANDGRLRPSRRHGTMMHTTAVGA